jgi:hypothetical protein
MSSDVDMEAMRPVRADISMPGHEESPALGGVRGILLVNMER